MASKSAIRFSFVFYLMYQIAVSLPEDQYNADFEDGAVYSVAPYAAQNVDPLLWRQRGPSGNGDPYDSDGLKPLTREERRKQKQKNERRMERKGKKEERRRNRYRLNNQRTPILGNDEEESSYNNFNNQERYLTTGAVEDTAVAQRNSLQSMQSVQNIAWLASNLTSIWSILYQMQRDIKQIRRNYRPTNQNRMQDVVTEKQPVTFEAPEVCDPLYERDANGCIDANGTVCGGRGHCSCGQCICNAPHYGIHCHCNDMDCSSDGGVLCGGAGKGQCSCGMCWCRPEWYGKACECSASTAACMTPYKEICAGNGKCVCNRCQCEDGYAGKLCEESIYSASMCERLKLCVLCQAFGRLYPQCEDCNIKFQFVEELESSRSTCLMTNLGCILMYSYTSPANKDGSVNVFVKKDMNCPTS